MQIKRLSPNLGAEIRGVNLLEDSDGSLKSEITRLLGEHEVLFFKGQPVLSAAEYLKVASQMGQPMCHPFISPSAPVVPGISPFQPYREIPEITGIYHDEKNKGNLNEWHSDLNWLASPSLGSVLRCLQRPALGGDTVWASMTAAYKHLSDEKKARIEELQAIHDFSQIYRGSFRDKEGLSKMQNAYPAQAHPLVLKHPLYGKKSIFVNRVSTTGIVGMSDTEARDLLESLYVLAKIPEFQCRYSWEEGDIALWDNLLTQHYAISDYFPNRRKMERISLAGLNHGVAHV